VGVLDAEQKPPAPTACEQQVEERGARVTEVQLPGGTRGEAGNPLPLPARGWRRARAHDAMVRETCKAQQSAAHRCAVLWKRRRRRAGGGAVLAAAPCWQRRPAGGGALLAAAPCYRIRRAPRLPRRATEDSM